MRLPSRSGPRAGCGRVGRLPAGPILPTWPSATRTVTPDRYLTVRYESMVGQPEQTLHRLCDFLGEEYTVDMLTMAGAPEFRAKISKGLDLAPDQTPVTSDYIGRYRQGVPEQDIAFIQAHAGRQMRDFDYQMEAIDFSLGERLRFNLLTRPRGLASMWIWLGLEKLQHRFPGRVGRTPRPRMRLSRPAGKNKPQPVAGSTSD